MRKSGVDDLLGNGVIGHSSILLFLAKAVLLNLPNLMQMSQVFLYSAVAEATQRKTVILSWFRHGFLGAFSACRVTE